MDYKEKYEQALERAKKIHNQTEFDYEKGMMEEIFPELKESEDEKIRKWLIDWAKAVNWSEQFTVTKEQVLAWLEKQGEQKPFDYENANIQQKDFTPKETINKKS